MITPYVYGGLFVFLLPLQVIGRRGAGSGAVNLAVLPLEGLSADGTDSRTGRKFHFSPVVRGSVTHSFPALSAAIQLISVSGLKFFAALFAFPLRRLRFQIHGSIGGVGMVHLVMAVVDTVAQPLRFPDVFYEIIHGFHLSLCG